MSKLKKMKNLYFLNKKEIWGGVGLKKKIDGMGVGGFLD
jgi:hypothetical protein